MTKTSGHWFLVPGSRILEQYDSMLGAIPTSVALKVTPTAIKRGLGHALDPSVAALCAFDFMEVLFWIILNAPVPEGQVDSCNLTGRDALPPEVRDI